MINMRPRPALLSFHLWCFSDSAQVSGDGYLGSMETYGSCGMDQHKNKLHGFFTTHILRPELRKKVTWSRNWAPKLPPASKHDGNCSLHQPFDLGPFPIVFFETLNIFGGNLRQHYPTNQPASHVLTPKKGRFCQHEATTPPRHPMGFAYPRNIHMVNATTAKLSSMHFHGWERGSMAEVR